MPQNNLKLAKAIQQHWLANSALADYLPEDQVLTDLIDPAEKTRPYLHLQVLPATKRTVTNTSIISETPIEFHFWTTAELPLVVTSQMYDGFDDDHGDFALWDLAEDEPDAIDRCVFMRPISSTPGKGDSKASLYHRVIRYVATTVERRYSGPVYGVPA